MLSHNKECKSLVSEEEDSSKNSSQRSNFVDVYGPQVLSYTSFELFINFFVKSRLAIQFEFLKYLTAAPIAICFNF